MGVFPEGFIELLDSGGKAGPIENGNWKCTVWGFQLFHWVYRPMGLGRYRRGVGVYLGGGLPNGIIEFLDACGETGPIENGCCESTGWGFQLLHGSIARWVWGVIGDVWAFIRGGLPRRVYGVIGFRREIGPD